MAVDTIYIVVSDETAVVLDNTSIPGPPGPGSESTGTVQSVNNIAPDLAGNIELPLDFDPVGTAAGLVSDLAGLLGTAAGANVEDFAAALTADQNYVTDNQAAALTAADTLSADNPVATMQDVIHSALVGVSANLFFCDDASPIAGWHELEAEATAQPSGEHSAVLAYNVLTLLDKYVSAPLNATRVPAGMWEFNLHAKMSSAVGTNLLDIQLLIVHANGTTTVPTGWNVPIRSVDVNSTTYAAYAIPVALPAAEGLVLTDRVGVIVSGIKTTAGADATMYFSHDLTSGNLSNVQTPMVAKIKGSDVELLPPSGTGNLPATVTDVELLKQFVNGMPLGGDIAIVSVVPEDAVVGTLYGIPNADYPAPTIVTAANQSFLASSGVSSVPIALEEFSGFINDVVISFPYDTAAFAPTAGGSGANRTYSIAACTAKSGSLTVRATTIFGKTAQQTVSIVAASQFFTITGTAGSNGTIPASTQVAEGGNATITPTPNSGYRTDLLTIDGGAPVAATSWTFNNVTANHTVAATFALNVAPTISDIANQSTTINAATGAIAFTIGDEFTPVGDLTVSATSSNLALVPNANLVLGGSGANRTITSTPATLGYGTSTVTVTVSDGGLTASDTFVLTVLQQLIDPFIRPDSTTIGNSWREINGDFAIVSNRVTITTPASDCMIINDAINAADVMVQANILVDSPITKDLLAQVIARSTSETVGAFTNYSARYINNKNGAQSIRLYKTIAGTSTLLGNVALSTFVNGDILTVKFSLVGTALKVKCWKVGTGEPAWQIEIADSSITAAGKTGIGTLGGNVWYMTADGFDSAVQ